MISRSLYDENGRSRHPPLLDEPSVVGATSPWRLRDVGTYRPMCRHILPPGVLEKAASDTRALSCA